MYVQFFCNHPTKFSGLKFSILETYDSDGYSFKIHKYYVVLLTAQFFFFDFT